MKARANSMTSPLYIDDSDMNSSSNAPAHQILTPTTDLGSRRKGAESPLLSNKKSRNRHEDSPTDQLISQTVKIRHAKSNENLGRYTSWTDLHESQQPN